MGAEPIAAITALAGTKVEFNFCRAYSAAKPPVSRLQFRRLFLAALQGLRRRAFLVIDNGERSDRRFNLTLQPADRSRPNLSRRRKAPIFDASPKRRC